MRAAILLFFVSLTVQARVVETVVPALVYDHACVTRVEIRNLANRRVSADVEGHRGSGSLAPFVGRNQIHMVLPPAGREILTLDISEETESAWLRVRESVPWIDQNPGLSIAARTECTHGDDLLSSVREATSPLRDPWFSGEVADDVLSLVNVSERAVYVTGCYGTGTLVSVPDQDFHQLCSREFDELVPAFAARRYAVRKGENTYFSLRCTGEAVALQMLHQIDAGARVFRVNSSITFGGEAPPGR